MRLLGVSGRTSAARVRRAAGTDAKDKESLQPRLPFIFSVPKFMRVAIRNPMLIVTWKPLLIAPLYQGGAISARYNGAD